MTSKAWTAAGSTRAWRKTRELVLQRDGHRCQLRHPGCTGHATEVHHLDGKAAGDSPDRCIAACHRCHAVETSKQTRTAVAKRPKAARPASKHPGLK